LPGRIDTTV